MSGAIYVQDSGNSKLNGSRKVDATYASIQATCPKTCPFMGEGCYAQMGMTAYHTRRLDVEAQGMSALAIAKAEAKAIDQSYKGGKVPEGRDLRIHVAGDARSATATRIIAKAIDRWKARGGGRAWSYTHAHDKVPRTAWGQVSTLASVESVSQVKAARQQGYAPAIVVSEFESDKAFKLPNCDTTWIPCPAQTKPGGKEIGCTDCHLCMKADWLFETNRGIAFAAHGVGQKKIKRHLEMVK